MAAATLVVTATLAPSTLAEVLSTKDAGRARELALSVDGAAVPADLGAALHAALQRPAHPAGGAILDVALADGRVRKVAVRIPAGYDPQRSWPLLLVMHWSGGTAPEALAAAERQLGTAMIDQWVVAAPHDYRQTGLDAPPPFADEHPRVLRALREQFHLDADRTVVLGWSLGGYTAWMWALLHGEELAAAVAIASTTSTPPDDTGLWEAVAPAAAPIPVLTAWGAVDRYPVTAADGGSLGTIAELNRRLRDRHAADPQAANWRWHELSKLGHGVLELEHGLVEPFLGARRGAAPDRVERRFRHLHQGKVWWLEATALGGPLWGEALPKVDRRKGESRREALGRTLLEHLPRLAGSRTLAADGSELISIERHLVDALEIHFECSRLAARREVVVTEGGAEVFRGTVAPSLALALLEARQSLDFERPTCAILARDATGAWSVKRP